MAKIKIEDFGVFGQSTLIETLPIFDPLRHVVSCSTEPKVAIKG